MDSKIIAAIALIVIVSGIIGFTQFSAVYDPPHLEHSGNLDSTSGAVTFSGIKHPENVYKITGTICNCLGYSVHTPIYLDKATGQKIGFSSDTCTNLNYADVGGAARTTHYYPSTFSYEPTSFSGSLSYEISALITESGVARKTGVTFVSSGPSKNGGTCVSSLTAYEKVECVIDSDCSDNRICQTNLCTFPPTTIIKTCSNGLTCPTGSTCTDGICLKTETKTIEINNSVMYYMDQTCNNNPGICKDGSQCIDGYCFKYVYVSTGCKSDSDCQSGYSCTESGMCQAKEIVYQTCEDFSCDKGESCINQVCTNNYFGAIWENKLYILAGVLVVLLVIILAWKR